MVDRLPEGIKLDKIAEGFLVKGTNDEEVGRKALHVIGQVEEHSQEDYAVDYTGWLRKVPSQWSDFRLYEAEPHSRGAFLAITFFNKTRHFIHKVHID
jgi:hypothetical protein